jgi:hypothetical protein
VGSWEGVPESIVDRGRERIGLATEGISAGQLERITVADVFERVAFEV